LCCNTDRDNEQRETQTAQKGRPELALDECAVERLPGHAGLAAQNIKRVEQPVVFEISGLD
jgi:hypothetical protein